MAVMTLAQVKEARQMCYDALQAHPKYSPDLQITSKEQLVQVAKDIFLGDFGHRFIPEADSFQERGSIGLHVWNKTGGMFIGLLERIKDDNLRNAIIDEACKDDPSPDRFHGSNRYPGTITAGSVSLHILRSGCTTADMMTLKRIASGTTKYTNPDSLPDFMKSPAARGLYLGSKYAQV